MKQRTYMAKPNEVEQKWYVVDADGKVLGRLAAPIATVLMGKNKPTYTPHVDTGDFVVVINAAKIKLTGNKLANKNYYRNTGYPGGLRVTGLDELMAKDPAEVVRRAVRGMLPKNTLARTMFSKLKVYAGPEHPHEAQMPQPLDI